MHGQPYIKTVISIHISGVNKDDNRDGIVWVILPVYNAYEVRKQWSETSAYEIQTPGNHSKERMVSNLVSHICEFVLPSDLPYAGTFLTADLSYRELGKTPSCTPNQAVVHTMKAYRGSRSVHP